MDALHYVIQAAAIADARQLEAFLHRPTRPAAPPRWERGGGLVEAITVYAEALP